MKYRKNKVCYNKNMNWDKATDIMVYTAIITAGILALLGLYQWVTRKSIKKVDKSLIALVVPLALVVLTYFVFDKILILNTRPNGSGEPSFPSTHTMITATIFFCAAIALPQYIKQKAFLMFLDLIMLTFVVLVPVGRVLANKHWVSDVVAGLAFSAIFAGIYYLTVKKITKSSTSHQVNQKESNNE